MAHIPLTIHDVLPILNGMSALVAHTFGPNGQAAVLKDSLGQICVSSSGRTILQSCQQTHPVGKLIENAASKLHAMTGNGIKTYILLLSHITKGVSEHLGCLPKSDQTLAKQAQLQLQNQFTQILNILPEHFEKIHEKNSKPKLDEPILNSLLKTFFAGKHPPHVSEVLTNLILKLISQTSKHASLMSTISYISDNFDHLFTKLGCVCIDSSIVVSGLLLNGQVCNYNEDLQNETSQFILIASDANSNECELMVDKDCTIKSFIKEINQWSEQIVVTLKKHEVSVVITNGVMLPELSTCCSQAGITVIQLQDSSDLEFIAKVAKVELVPLTGMHTIQPCNIRKLNFVKMLAIGNELFINLQPGVHSCIRPHHMIICGPTQPLSKEYSSTCQDALKYLKTITENSEFPVHYQIEKYENNALTKSRYRCNSECHCDQELSNSAFLICPAGGYWELFMYYLLEHDKRPSSNLASKMLGKALFNIVKNLHDNSYRGKKERFIIVAKKIVESLETPHPMIMNATIGTVDQLKCDNEFSELIIAKEILIQTVIHTVVQILKVDLLVGVNTNSV